ncbi:MAG: TonB-dependent receptor [Bacteroidetes bacterium]|nr:TonB-dependent receptor [Bacteroidota bacterium]
MQKIFLVLTALVMSSTLLAQQDTSFLQEVVVTANKVAKKQTETAKVVSVINREMLRQSGGRSLGELLNQVAGVTVPGSNNNLGSNQTISIRGASAGNVLVLLDGIPVNDPSVISNYFDINLLSTDQIERIEILKGGHSTLYGSDAVAGVVNIISRKTQTGKPNVNASLAGGSFNTLRSTIGITGAAKKTDYLLQLSSINSDGFSASADSVGDKGFDKDKYQQTTARAQVGYKTGLHGKLTTGLLYSRYKTDLDAGAFKDEKDFVSTNTNQQFNLEWQHRGAKNNLSVQYQYNQVERNYLDDSLFRSSAFVRFAKSNYIGRSHFADLYASTKLQNWELLAGADFRHHSTVQDYFSVGSWGPFTAPTLRAYMAQLSAYGSAVYQKNNFTTELGGRFNYHSEYGNNATFTINPAYRINNAVRIFGNLYTAYKTPTLYQLFDSYAGNDSLRPEKGFIQELGIDLSQGKKFSARVVAFNRKSKETIIYTYNPLSWSGKYLNVSSQTNYGFETELQWNLQPLSIRVNYAYTNGSTRSGFDGTGLAIGKDSSYYNLYRIPKHALNWQASYQLKNWIFNLSGRVAASREEFIYGASPITMQGYATVDLYSEYRFKKVKGLRGFMDLRNLTNTKYEEIRGYNTRGFNVMIGLLVGR